MRITTNFTHTDRQAVYAHDANGEPYAIAITNATQPGQSRVIEKGTKNEFYTVNLSRITLASWVTIISK